jgi:hypothetical protein
MAEIVVHRNRQVRRTVAKKSCPVPFAGDVWAAPDAGRWDAIHDLHLEEARDCQWEAGRDFRSATVEPARCPILPEHLDEPPLRQAQRPRDEWLTAV